MRENGIDALDLSQRPLPPSPLTSSHSFPPPTPSHLVLSAKRLCYRKRGRDGLKCLPILLNIYSILTVIFSSFFNVFKLSLHSSHVFFVLFWQELQLLRSFRAFLHDNFQSLWYFFTFSPTFISLSHEATISSTLKLMPLSNSFSFAQLSKFANMYRACIDPAFSQRV